MAEPKKKPKEVIKKAVVKKTVKSISNAKKPTKKKTTTKAMAPKTTKKKAVLSPIQLDDVGQDLVRIPSTASLRLLEKVEIYKAWYKEVLPKYASTLARTGGYTFIFFGVLAASFGHLSNKDTGINAAALVCSLGQCEEVDDNDLPDGAPSVTFLNSLPTELSNNTDILLEAKYAGNFTLTLTSLTSGAIISISDVERISDTRYRFIIPGLTLPVGTYQTKVIVKQSPDISYVFEGPAFSVKGENTKAEITKAKVETAIVNETIEIERKEDIIDSDLTVSNPSSSSSTEPSSDEPVTENLEEEMVEVSSQEINLNQIDLQLYEEESSTYLKVSTGDYNPNQVLIYALLPRSENSVLIGEATLAQSSWYFSLSAYDLPKNEYLVYASFTEDEREYQTKGVYYIPVTIAKETSLKIEDIIILSKKIDLALNVEASSTNSRLRYFSDNNFEADIDNSDVSSSLIAAVKSEVLSNEDSLNQLYFNYASVAQVGNQYLIALAKNQILKKYKSIYSSVLATEADLKSQTVLESSFANIIEKQLAFVYASENDIRLQTNGLTGKDTDNDGLPDYDELTIYQTSPLKADTDLDGILDSVEILTGTDALVPDTKEMPFHNFDTRLTAPDKEILSIFSIKEEIVKNQLSSANKTNYIISGVAVPNSFVHLIIPGARTVGLIRAGTGGEFSYLLEKELNNNEAAQVVAGIADGSGRLVAGTQIYKFNNKNDLSASASEIFLKDTYANVSLRDSVVIGAVGLVALGFVLLLLAQMNARSRSTKLTIQKSA